LSKVFLLEFRSPSSEKSFFLRTAGYTKAITLLCTCKTKHSIISYISRKGSGSRLQNYFHSSMTSKKHEFPRKKLIT
jgi:hypothetical protein